MNLTVVFHLYAFLLFLLHRLQKKFLTKPLDIKELVEVLDEYVPIRLFQ